MKKIVFYFKQLFPMTYYSKYKKPDGKYELAVWKQWLGKPFAVTRYPLA